MESKVDIARVVDSPFCVAIDDGNVVHDRIAKLIAEGNIAVVSFSGVKRLTTAFLNAAIGQLYNEFSAEQIRTGLRVADASQDQLRLIKRVVDNAKKFFANPARADQVIRDLNGEE
jgi:hypothetical protein